MKWILLIILLAVNIFANAATRFKLVKKTGDAEIYLTLSYSDSSFVIVCLGSPHYDHHISSKLSSGSFIKVGDTVYLRDSLWMIHMNLIKTGKDYRIAKGPEAFRGHLFNVEREYKEAPLTAREKQQFGFNDFEQVYDSIRTSLNRIDTGRSETSIKSGMYKFPMPQASPADPMEFIIELKKDHSFIYRLNKDKLTSGTWKHKGNYIFFYTSNQTYVLQVMSLQELKVLYFPFVDVGFVFATNW